MALTPQELLEMYRKMVTIRRFDQRAVEEFHAGNIPGVVHAYIGQEAVAVGVCAALRRDDKIVSTHRGHGHTIAKGADIRLMPAELFGRRNGYCHGKGGSMHIADFSVGMLGANGIVGAGMPIATGAALAARLEKSDRVAVAFFGDGASNEGAFHGSLNLASIWKLPVIYVCENNRWAIADEACVTCSAAAEIAALLTEDPPTFRALKAPPKRVCAPDVPIPYSPVMERFCLPDKDRIIAGIREVLA
jgi:pyruvate dehydrogenase E1 component alpha subunit